MKKFYALCISFVMLISCISLPVSAAETGAETGSVGVSVFYQEWSDSTPVFDKNEMYGLATSDDVHDLSDSNMTIYWTLPGEGSLQSGLCKTNTTIICVGFDLNRDASVKVELLDSSGNSLAETTLTYYIADGRTPTVKFTNLTSTKNYRVKITNNSQNQVIVVGSVRDSVF